MFRPSRFARALIAVLCLSSVSLAQSPAPESAAPAVSNVELPSELSSFFPASTTLYFEAHGVGASLERQPGALEQLYSVFPMFLPNGKDGAPPSMPLTIDELRMLLRSDVAFGSALGDRGDPGMLTILRTPSPEAAALFRDKVLALALASASKQEPRTETVKGQVITTAGTTPSALAFAYAITRETVVLGTEASVRAVYESTSKRGEKLTDAAGFSDARRRLSSSAEAFMWVDIAGMIPSASPGTTAPTTGVRGLALATTDSLAELLLTLDRSKESFASLLVDAPTVDMRAAELLPPNVQAVATFGLQPARVYDYLASPAAATDLGSRLAPPPAAWAQELESRTGVRTREELFTALGERMTIALDFADMIGDAKGPRTIAAGVPRPLFLIEVTQPDVARRALVRLAGPPSDAPTEETVDGIVVSRVGDSACAVVDNLAVLGSRTDVDAALAAHKSGDTFAASPASAALREQLAGNTVGDIYLSTGLEKTLLAQIVRQVAGPNAPTDLGITPPPFVVSANKEELGLYASTRSAASSGLSVVGIMASVAIPSLVRARSAANESSAIGTLRRIGNAAATYQSHTGHFGTFSQLVAEGYLDASICEGCVRNGYRFIQSSASAKTFDFAAVPEPGAMAGDKAYNIMEDYVIRYATAPTVPKRKSGRVLGR